MRDGMVIVVDDSATEAMLTFGRQILARQNFSRFIGAELSAFDGIHVELRIPIRDELRQQNGFVHGGVLAYAADNVLTFAGGLTLGSAVLTSEFKINYVRPGVGDAIVARGSVMYGGKAQAVCRAEIYTERHGTATLVAVAQGTIVRIGSEPAAASSR